MSKSKSKEPTSSGVSSGASSFLDLEVRAEGIVLPVKAQPGAGRNELRGFQDGALKVCVTQIAEKGKANKAIVEFLAKALKLRKSQLELTTGELSGQKKFLVRDVDESELRAKIDAAL